MLLIKNSFDYRPLGSPIPITQQKWPAGTEPLVFTRTMAYMHQEYIRDCIEGILMQHTTFPVCIALHDDASTDKTAEIIREYECKYPRIIKAYYQSRNTYRLSSEEKLKLRKPFHDLIIGKYCAICEGDDYWTDKYKLQKQVNVLESRRDCSMVFHAVNYVDYSNKKVILTHRNGNKSRDYDVAELILGGGGFVPTLSMVYRRDFLIERPNFFRNSPVGDYPFVLLAAIKGKVHYIDEVMGCYRCNVPGSAMDKVRKKSFEDQVSRYERFAGMLYTFDEYTSVKYHRYVLKKASSLITASFLHASKSVSFFRKLRRMRKIRYPLRKIDFLLISISVLPYGGQILGVFNAAYKKLKCFFSK